MSKDDFHWLWFGRKLAELYTISILNRIEGNRLEHQKEQQKKKQLRKIIAKDFRESIEKGLHRKYGGKLGQVFLMNKGFPGSTAYYQNKYADLQTIVQKLGNPTWYLNILNFFIFI